MKKLLVLAALAAATSFVPSPAVANDAMALRICEYVSANDKNRLRSYLKRNKLKLRNIFDPMECNGDNLLIFAAKGNALDVGEFIIGKISTKVVAANIEALKTHSAHLAEAAEKRVNK